MLTLVWEQSYVDRRELRSSQNTVTSDWLCTVRCKITGVLPYVTATVDQKRTRVLHLYYLSVSFYGSS
jgi:hypothetical protein